MKDIIVIEGKDLKCAEDKNYVIARKEKCKVEKYPTNWEELKGLCEKTRYISQICKDKNIPVYLNEFGTGYIIIKDLYFGVNGIVFYEVLGQRYVIAENLTPARQWQIIKSLIGEE